MQLRRLTREATAGGQPAGLAYALLVLLVLLGGLFWAGACRSDDTGDGNTGSTVDAGTKSGDVEGTVGTDIHVGPAVVTVRALQATFQPATPVQRLLETTPSAPGEGQSFYQARVRVTNTSQTPLRVDPNDFACMVGNSVLPVDPTRTGPLPRSILENTSFDLLLTFKGPAGYQPLLLYSPPWHQGVISVTPAEPSPTTS